MNSQDHETLSAMLDNEADELELRRLVKATAGDPDLASKWKRLNLVQALIHDDNLKSTGELHFTGNRLSDAVAAAIAHEPEQLAETAVGNRWAQPLAKVAIAASVAMAFFVGMQVSVNESSRLPGTPEVAQQGQAGDAGQAAELPVTELAVVENRPAGAPQVDPEARLRLEEYIRSASITRDEPQKLEQLEDSPLYRLVNERQD
jgi:sigma-E factor negative regulatory protein RseA